MNTNYILPRFRFFRPLRMVFLLSVVVCGAMRSTAQPPNYSIADLGTLGGIASQGIGINDAGLVVGVSLVASNNASHATLFSVDTNGVATALDLGTPAGHDSRATAINNANQIVGSSSFPVDDMGDYASHAALFAPDGSLVTDMTSTSGLFTSAARAINDSGQVAGTDQDNRPVLFTINDDGSIGETNFYSPTVDSPLYFPTAIDEFGDVVGFSLSGTNYTALEFVVEDTGVTNNIIIQSNSVAFDINDSGLIVGGFLTNGVDSAVSWTNATGTNTNIGSLGGSVGTLAAALASNVGGHTVGVSTYPSSIGATHAFIVTTGGTVTDINTLVGTNPIATNITLANGLADWHDLGSFDGKPLNAWGQIAAQGTVSNGQNHALLLTPTSSPPVMTNTTTMNAWLMGGMNYNLIPAFTESRAGGINSTVRFLDGVAGSTPDEDGTMRRQINTHFEANPGTTPIASDAVSVSANLDTYVLQLSFLIGNAGREFGSTSNACLCRYKAAFGKPGSWLHNAVEDSVGGQANFAGVRAYNPATDFHLGTYGVDTVHSTVWAVINHSGTYGVGMNPDTVRTISSFGHTNTTSTLKITSFTGYAYQLQRATALTNSFASVKAASNGVTGTTLTITNSDGSAAAGFYRLLIGP